MGVKLVFLPQKDVNGLNQNCEKFKIQI